MFEKIDLILKSEDEELFLKQQRLIEEFKKTLSSEILIQIALLQIMTPICDSHSAIKIMEEYIFDDIEFLFIGAHLCAEQLEVEENIFLNKLFSMKQRLNNEQQSVVKYLAALHEYNRANYATETVILNLEESIALCNKLVSNYYLRYLLFHNASDKIKAQCNVLKVVSVEECENLSLDEMIEGSFYIEEYITMQSLSKPVFEGMFFDM